MRGLAGLMMSLLALAAAAPGVAGGVGAVAGGSGVAGGPPSLTGVPSLAGPPCATATTQTLVSIDGNVAERIYRDELVEAGRSPTSTRSKKTARC